MLFWPRLWIIKRIPYFALCLLLTGCFATPKSTVSRYADAGLTSVSNTTANLDMMSWIGGISILGGIAAMVITRGAIGIRAVGIGIGLVLLNYAVARYADWIFIPILVATAAISLTFGYRVVRKAMTKKKEAMK